jgi:hypothetical protein
MCPHQTCACIRGKPVNKWWHCVPKPFLTVGSDRTRGGPGFGRPYLHTWRHRTSSDLRSGWRFSCPEPFWRLGVAARECLSPPDLCVPFSSLCLGIRRVHKEVRVLFAWFQTYSWSCWFLSLWGLMEMVIQLNRRGSPGHDSIWWAWATC